MQSRTHRVSPLLWLALILPALSARAGLDWNIQAGTDYDAMLLWNFSNTVTTAEELVRHVKTTGNDQTGDGSLLAPWKTIDHGVKQLSLAANKGRTLYVHPGTYYGTKVDFRDSEIKSGDGTAALTIMGVPGLDAPVLVAKAMNCGPSSDPALCEDNDEPMFRMVKPFWVIDGLKFNVDRTRRQAIRITSAATVPLKANYVVVRNSKVIHGQGTAAISVGAQLLDDVLIGSASYVENILLYNNELYDNYRPKSCELSGNKWLDQCLQNVKNKNDAGVYLEANGYVCDPSALCKGPIRGGGLSDGGFIYTCGSHSDCEVGYYCDDPSTLAMPSQPKTCRRRDDLHAVGVFYGSKNVWVQNNTMHDNSGDAVQCSGPREQTKSDGGVPNLDYGRPSDIALVNNHAYASPSSYGMFDGGVYGTTETAIDIKDCDRVSVRGGRYHGYRSVGRDDRGGAMVVHFTANEVHIEQTEVYDSCGGLSTGNNDNDSVGNLVFNRNVFHHMSSACSGRYGIQSTALHGADIFHNVFSEINGVGISLGEYASSGRRSDDIDVWNNIFYETVDTAQWAAVYSNGSNQVEFDYNLYHNTATSAGLNKQKHFRCNFDDGRDLSEWRDCKEKPKQGEPIPPDAGFFTREPSETAAQKIGDPRFVNPVLVSDGGWDFHTWDGGLGRNAALLDNGNIALGERCNGGADKGRFESDCPDLSVDAGTDAGGDGGTDAGGDGGTDAGGDAGTDGGSDAGTDGGVDAGPQPPEDPYAGLEWEELGTTGFTGVATVMRLDSQDNPIVASVQSSVGGSAIRVRRWTSSGWTSLGLPIQAGPVASVHLQLAVGSDDVPIIAWSQENPSTGDYDITVQIWTGVFWQAIGSDISAISGPDTDAFASALAMDDSGRPVIAFTEAKVLGGTSDLVWRWDKVLETWTFLDAPGGTGDLRLDRLGNPFVAWSDGSSIYLQRWDDVSGWSYVGGAIHGGSTNPQASQPALQFDSVGTPFVAFRDYSATSSTRDIYVSRLDPLTSNWSNLPSSLSEAPWAGSHASFPSIALNSADEPIVAWREQDSLTSLSHVVYVSRWTGTGWSLLSSRLLQSGVAMSTGTPHLGIGSAGDLFLNWADPSTSPTKVFVYHGVP
ncbi:hypothetical protein [Melittangium boletus]|uniref:hypothetical protein n=1 Tax=Melittangium boletus TaxID=83453 RepID=UPI003DA668E9